MNLPQWIEAVIASPKISPESASRLEEISFHSEYAESGYTTPKSGIIVTGNWNDAEKRNRDYNPSKRIAENNMPWINADRFVSRVAKVLERRYGAELEWSDEWDICDHCSKLVRTSPNGHGWQKGYFDLDGSRICRECCANCAKEILESLEGSVSNAVTEALGINPEQHGYVKILGDLQHGLHEGMAADPKVIEKELRALGVDRFLFGIDEASQFYFTFSCYVHESELEKVGVDPDIKTDADVSPATLMKRALQGASESMQKAGPKPTESHVLVSTVRGETMESKWVSPEEFLKGERK